MKECCSPEGLPLPPPPIEEEWVPEPHPVDEPTHGVVAEIRRLRAALKETEELYQEEVEKNHELLQELAAAFRRAKFLVAENDVAYADNKRLRRENDRLTNRDADLPPSTISGECELDHRISTTPSPITPNPNPYRVDV